MTTNEWAVRWPGGEIEEHPTLERAQQVVRLYGEPVLISRTVTFGEWRASITTEPTTTCAHDVRHASTGRCTRCGQNGGTR